jgi:hypothetical protein
MKSGWWSRRAITLHLALIVVVPLFLVLAIWQLRRALHGNLLSWAYTFEWPFFAAYATWMWWKLVHEETAMAAQADPPVHHSLGSIERVATTNGPGTAGGETATESGDEPGRSDGDQGGASGETESSVAAPRLDWDPYDESDPELAAYNRYLASLHTSPRKR